MYAMIGLVQPYRYLALEDGDIHWYHFYKGTTHIERVYSNLKKRRVVPSPVKELNEISR